MTNDGRAIGELGGARALQWVQGVYRPWATADFSGKARRTRRTEPAREAAASARARLARRQQSAQRWRRAVGSKRGSTLAEALPHARGGQDGER